MPDRRPTPADHSKYLIDLIINQDQVSQNWIKFLITIEASLALAYYFVFNQASPNWFKTIGIILVPVMAATIAIGITWIIILERRWQHMFIAKLNAIPANTDKIFPTSLEQLSSPVNKLPLGIISIVVLVMSSVTIAAWIAVGAWVYLHANATSVPSKTGVALPEKVDIPPQPPSLPSTK